MPAVLSNTALANAESPIAVKIVFLDPGHNGANDRSITRQVSDGRGRTKDCQTSGTATDSGFPEHTFNWNVVLHIRQALTVAGGAAAAGAASRSTSKSGSSASGKAKKDEGPKRAPFDPEAT